MSLTLPPDPPSRSDPTTFAARGDAFVSWMETFVAEMNALILGGFTNASTLASKTWEAPGAIGSTTPNTGAFTTLSATGQFQQGTGGSTACGWILRNFGGIAGVSALYTTIVTPAAANYTVAATDANTNVNAPSGTVTLSVAGNAVAVTSSAALAVTGALSATSHIKLPSYTVATLPSAATAGAGAQVYVTDASGGAVSVVSNGTNWKLSGTQTTVS